MSESGDSASSESAQGGRFASFTQAHHAKSTVATKLNQAKKMAAVYQEGGILFYLNSSFIFLSFRHSFKSQTMYLIHADPVLLYLTTTTDEKRRKNGGQRRSGSRTRKSTQVESGYWESNNRVMHSGTFRF
mmetsp:Transcript_58801/g.110989  ORF Transcript_58801/g.110989 Transcript_58801/m.110989 type:complete len:131 (+) Transcript_58801:1-393(+)